MNSWMKSHQSRSVSCTLFLDRSINHIKSGNATTVLCTVHFGFVSPSFLSGCGGLNSAIYTLLLYVYLIIVLLFYYYLGLSLFYLGLKKSFQSYYLVSWAFFFFFFQVLNSNYSAKWYCSYSFFFSLIIGLCFFFLFSFKYLCKFVYILLYWQNKFHNIFIIIDVRKCAKAL